MAEADFNKLNEELETIIIDLQSGEINIDEVIKKYQRGIDLIDKLEKYLSQAENEIKKLKPKKSKN